MSSSRMAEMLLEGKNIDHIFPDEINTDVKKFNTLADKCLQLKGDIAPFDLSFNIPEGYLNLDVREYIYGKLLDEVDSDPSLSEDDIEARMLRVNEELSLFSQYEIIDLLKTTIYIVDTFISNDVVWGTGRGSSCASYCLYLIGIHEVDSIKYNLELSEFFRRA